MSQASTARTAAPATAPTAIPAFAPVLRLGSLEAAEVDIGAAKVVTEVDGDKVELDLELVAVVDEEDAALLLEPFNEETVLDPEVVVGAPFKEDASEVSVERASAFFQATLEPVATGNDTIFLRTEESWKATVLASSLGHQQYDGVVTVSESTWLSSHAVHSLEVPLQ